VWQGNGMGVAWEWHGVCELALMCITLCIVICVMLNILTVLKVQKVQLALVHTTDVYGDEGSAYCPSWNPGTD
jgi:hypothetical protein